MWETLGRLDVYSVWFIDTTVSGPLKFRGCRFVLPLPFPGSSMVEHSAVNYTAEHRKPLFWRRLATKLSPLLVPQLCPMRLFRLLSQFQVKVFGDGFEGLL